MGKNEHHGTSRGDEPQAEQSSRIEAVSVTSRQLIELIDMVGYLARKDSEDPDKRRRKREAGLLLDQYYPPSAETTNTPRPGRTDSRWSSLPDDTPGKPYSFSFRIAAIRNLQGALSLVNFTIYTNNRDENTNAKGRNPHAVATVTFPLPRGNDSIRFELTNKMTEEYFYQAKETVRDAHHNSLKPAPPSQAAQAGQRR